MEPNVLLHVCSCSHLSALSLLCIQNCFCFIHVDVLRPTNVRATVVAPRSIQIMWESFSSSDVTGYLISYTTTASYVSSNKRSQSITVNNTSGTLTNLEEHTLYTITVHATTSDNRMSGNSNEVSVRTYTDGKYRMAQMFKGVKF